MCTSLSCWSSLRLEINCMINLLICFSLFFLLVSDSVILRSLVFTTNDATNIALSGDALYSDGTITKSITINIVLVRPNTPMQSKFGIKNLERSQISPLTSLSILIHKAHPSMAMGSLSFLPQLASKFHPTQLLAI